MVFQVSPQTFQQTMESTSSQKKRCVVEKSSLVSPFANLVTPQGFYQRSSRLPIRVLVTTSLYSQFNICAI